MKVKCLGQEHNRSLAKARTRTARSGVKRFARYLAYFLYGLLPGLGGIIWHRFSLRWYIWDEGPQMFPWTTLPKMSWLWQKLRPRNAHNRNGKNMHIPYEEEPTWWIKLLFWARTTASVTKHLALLAFPVTKHNTWNAAKSCIRMADYENTFYAWRRQVCPKCPN